MKVDGVFGYKIAVSACNEEMWKWAQYESCVKLQSNQILF